MSLQELVIIRLNNIIKKKGILKSLKQLSLYEEFTPIDLERIEPYICYNK